MCCLSTNATYRLLSFQAFRLNRIVVEAPPFLESLPRKLMVLVGVPIQHCRVISHAYAPTERLDGRRWLLHHFVCVDDADFRARLTALADTWDDGLKATIALAAGAALVVVRGDVRPDQSDAPQVVERATHLVIPSLGGIIVIEPSHIVQWRDGTTVVRGHTEMGVPDEEGKMELRPDFRGHHGRIARLGIRVIRVGFLRLFILPLFHDGGRGLHLADRGSRKTNAAVNLRMSMTVEFTVRKGPVPISHTIVAFLRLVVVGACSVNDRGVAINGSVCAYAALYSPQRRGDAGGFTVRGKEIVNDVFDEDPLALLRKVSIVKVGSNIASNQRKCEVRISARIPHQERQIGALRK